MTWYIRSHMFSHYCKWLLKAHHYEVGEEHENVLVAGIRWEVGLQLQCLKCPQEGAHIIWHNRWGETKLEDCSSKANVSMWISTLVVFFFFHLYHPLPEQSLQPPRSSPEKGGAYVEAAWRAGSPLLLWAGWSPRRWEPPWVARSLKGFAEFGLCCFITLLGKEKRKTLRWNLALLKPFRVVSWEHNFVTSLLDNRCKNKRCPDRFGKQGEDDR